MPDLRESVEEATTAFDAARVKELDKAAEAKAFDPRTPTYNPTDLVATRREPTPPAPGLNSPVLLSLSARVHAASAERFEPRVGGTSDDPAPREADSSPAVAEPVEAPLEDEFGPIDQERWSQVPCADRRSLRVYELDTSDQALSEKDATAVREAEQVFAEALDQADGELGPDELQDLLEHINPTRSSHNCVECAMAVDDVLRGRPAAAGPTEDQPQHYLDAAMSVRQVDYVEELESEDVERLLLDAGPSARAIVIGWKNQHQSHAYNAVNFDGDVYWVDGQKNLMAEHDPHNYKTFDIYRTG